MGKYYDMLLKDVRFQEGMQACMNCGVCTSVCPSAEVYNYDPRQIMDEVQTERDEKIEELLKGDKIWYCGECMSCRPRCPRGNTPAYIIQALRRISQETGFFTHSEKGRQQLAIKRAIGQNILDLGFCVHPTRVAPDMHPEQGPVWEWIYKNDKEVFTRFDKGYKSESAGAMRNIDQSSLDELRSIFEVTGGMKFFETIEQHSAERAAEMGMAEEVDGVLRANNDYFEHVYTANNGTHNNE